MFFKKILCEKKSTVKIEFVTLDQTLNFLVENINVFYDESTVGKIQFYRELFPRLSTAQYDALFAELAQLA